jgi:hypothetical protein
MQHKKRKERREREGGLITHSVMRIEQQILENKANHLRLH